MREVQRKRKKVKREAPTMSEEKMSLSDALLSKQVIKFDDEPGPFKRVKLTRLPDEDDD